MSSSVVLRGAVCAVALFGSVSTVSAANVTDVKGQVQISRSGGPYMAISGTTECKVGDVVRALNESSARVVNANGAMQTVSPGHPVTCVGEQGFHGTGLSTGTIVAGAAVIGAVVIGAVVLSKTKSASP